MLDLTSKIAGKLNPATFFNKGSLRGIFRMHIHLTDSACEKLKWENQQNKREEKKFCNSENKWSYFFFQKDNMVLIAVAKHPYSSSVQLCK